MYIIAKMKNDCVSPYSEHGNKIPVVVESDHPEFTKGFRLDWGFVQVTIENGYILTIIP